MALKYPPLLLKYLKMFQEDPQSKVFAPLAECYRKIGLCDEAIRICHEGLAHHPDFVSGKVALARAYFDKKNFRLVCETLRTEVDRVPDNLVAQKLFAEASLALGEFAAALKSYKMYLYFNPQDIDVARIAHDLEVRLYTSEGPNGLKTVSLPEKQSVQRLTRLQDLLERVQRHSLSN